MCDVTVGGSNPTLGLQQHAQKTDVNWERVFVLIYKQIQRAMGAVFLQKLKENERK